MLAVYREVFFSWGRAALRSRNRLNWKTVYVFVKGLFTFYFSEKAQSELRESPAAEMLSAAHKARKRGRFRPIRRRIAIDIASEPEMPPVVHHDDPPETGCPTATYCYS